MCFWKEKMGVISKAADIEKQGVTGCQQDIPTVDNVLYCTYCTVAMIVCCIYFLLFGVTLILAVHTKTTLYF